MTVSEQIISVLDSLCERFGIMIDWSQQNVLPYVQEVLQRLIKYEIVTSIFFVVFMTLTTVFLFIAAKETTKRAVPSNKNEELFEGLSCTFWLLFVLFCFSSFFVLLANAIDIIECLVIPEKYILSYILSLTGNS